MHAHPDDETLASGATMARYAAAGVAVTLVTCTLGEEGEVIPPELAHLTSDRDDTLGTHRIDELARACAALGVQDHRFLGGAGRWRDSGMQGTPQNDHPLAFCRADLDEAVAALVSVIRQVRPQVVVTYDDHGGYGHPDHVQAHRVTVAALERAADPTYLPRGGPAWQVQKLYWTAVPASVLARGLEVLAAADSGFAVAARVEDLGFGNPDGQVTTCVDASDHLVAKVAAMRAHATQIAVREPFYALSDGVGQVLRGTEWYVRADAPRQEHPMLTERESDLFDGVDDGLDTPNG